ncbi:hypothetical protein L6164_026010 [Bauhinia variegata]|uniref:Uncharacterized protein n=1 Tax=Bauhinia variegata TaxID=167791 RepID=A0ACB9M4G1_BAUVA|nr:hypothetical protein L6164_026010 [Bauhinia variegata]
MPSSGEFDSPDSSPSPDQSPPSPPYHDNDPFETPPSPYINESPPAPPSWYKSSPPSPFSPSSFSDSPTKSPSKQSSSSRHKHSHKSPPPLPSPPPQSHSEGGNDGSKRAAVGVGIGLGLIIFIWILICIVRSRRKKREEMYYRGDAKGSDIYNGKQQYSNYYKDQKGDHERRNNSDFRYASSKDQPLPPPPTSRGTITYEELEAATGGFDEKNLLGQGGFGYVHKGILSNGREVAVKSLKANSGQGEQEFQTEVDVISRVHHRHLVSLVGYCISGSKRLLVYEFVPNKTLEYHLHGKGLPTMDWPTRLRIAIGSARGLTYLHEECPLRIIHRDIKGSNILLNLNFEPKVADFGLAKLTTDNNTHVSTRVMGTFGYLAPEYASSGRLTEKSDVYSFGVMLLELITGKRPAGAVVDSYDQDGLVDWARPLLNSGLQNGNLKGLVDPFLEGNYNEQEMMRMARCASASIRHSSKRRPKMSQIVKILEGAISSEDLSSL